MLAAIHIQLIVGTIFIILYSVTILGLVLVIITENRNPLKTIPWVIVLLLAPGIGLLFYFFFGQDNRKQRIISRRTYKRIMKRPQEGKLPQDACVVPDPYKPLSTLLTNTNQSSLLYGTQITIYTNGTDKFKDLLEEIQKATHHIHIQYYIFCDDEIGKQVQQLLIKKVKEGVKVRVLYDDVGCWNVKDGFFKEMKEAGIEVYAFLRVAFPVFTSKVNYRNHRKIIVIDGKVGFMGGMNIADRYDKGTSWGTWRDTHFKFVGKGVHGLQSVFLIDWYVVSKKLLNDRIYYPAAQIYSDNRSNMDFRSFEHNFEINAFVYQPSFAQQMRKVFLHDMHSCERLVPSRWLKRPLKQRIAESFMRLFSPSSLRKMEKFTEP